ncbi:rCG57930 [Rattus norvegicus]|uniref:RCG57930 n=1 Tax=Rattus norvegicus TaxID=10116 RepID=A6J4H4_RAT|nr:rCG57930 [Rattus norvegicus]
MWLYLAQLVFYQPLEPEDQTRERTPGSEGNPLPGTTSFLPLANVSPCFLSPFLLLRFHGCPLAVLFILPPPFSIPCFLPVDVFLHFFSLSFFLSDSTCASLSPLRESCLILLH